MPLDRPVTGSGLSTDGDQARVTLLPPLTEVPRFCGTMGGNNSLPGGGTRRSNGALHPGIDALVNPAPFSKMVASASAAGLEPSQCARASPFSARVTSSALSPE